MYIDGHFLPYYGLYPIRKSWHGVRQRPLEWANDLAEEQFNRAAQVTYEIRKAEAIPYLETTLTMSKYGKIRAVMIQAGEDKERAANYTNGTVEEIGSAAQEHNRQMQHGPPASRSQLPPQHP